jgi:hypothetical protein
MTEHHTEKTEHHEHKENLIADGHKVARQARKVDSAVYMGEVIASGNPRRIMRYFIRKIAYKIFGRFMGKTLSKI